MDDYLAAEARIIQRLQGEVPALTAVLGAPDLEGVLTSKQPAPAAHILYDGETVQEQAGQNTIVHQSWRVLLVVKNLRDRTTANQLRQQAGPLLFQINHALQGWRPEGGGFGELKKLSAPRAAYGNGLGYFTLRYAVPVFFLS